MKDFLCSIVVVVIMFIVLAAEHTNNTLTIDEQHNIIYQQESQIDDLKYQVGQCRLLTEQNNKY